MPQLEYPHLFVKSAPDDHNFTSHQSGRDNINFPDRANRKVHAAFVRKALDGAWQNSDKNAEERKAISLPTRTGTYIEFQSAPDFDLKTKSLDLTQSGIRLLNVVEKEDLNGQTITYATVFVPDGKQTVLIKKIDQYALEETKAGKPKNEPLIAGIEYLREAVLDSFWRDQPNLVPVDTDWCEAWLRYSGNQHDDVVNEFTTICAQIGIEAREGYLRFPERTVCLVNASQAQLIELLLSCDSIAEFRAAKSTGSFWMNLDNSEQSEWVSELAERTDVTPDTNTTACILDTGVNNGHVLLQKLISDTDCHSVVQDWGTSDTHGHGTLMSGVVAYGGELDRLLQSSEPVEIPFKIECVKLIPSPGVHHDKQLYGLRTQQAISRAEVESPESNRSICLSITSEDYRDEGRPSSWSGAIDQIASGAEDESRRLIIVAAGNVNSPSDWNNYPTSNFTQAVHDPGQSWNALTVGAFTEKVDITDPELIHEYAPIAKSGELSPFSTTSHLWDKKWPNKPDIVLEGGNAAKDTSGFSSELDDLSILSTNSLPQESQLCLLNATSAASAQATNFASRLSAQYPEAWPETARALMVHSADWPEPLKSQFRDTDRTDKQNHEFLLKSCGYGVPNFESALESASNSLTLIVEQEIQPFQKKDGQSGYETKEMHLIDLPWPIEALSELPGETEVIVNITLSYFIEPGPGEIGWRDKYRYRSHGLDFDLIGPAEDRDEFLRKLNKAALDASTDEAGYSGGTSIDWEIGSTARNRGSLHRDWWKTTAANAAGSNVIGVFPRTGWWKERAHLAMGNRKTRYSLVVTLQTPPQSVDIYTPVSTSIQITNEIQSAS